MTCSSDIAVHWVGYCEGPSAVLGFMYVCIVCILSSLRRARVRSSQGVLTIDRVPERGRVNRKEKAIFAPKKTFLAIFGKILALLAHVVPCWLVIGCGARAALTIERLPILLYLSLRKAAECNRVVSVTAGVPLQGPH